MQRKPSWLKLVSIAAALMTLALTGCSTRTSVQATATTAAEVTHLYVTVQEVWFNTSSTDTAEDGGWVKKVLSTPVTVDLASLNGGELEQLTSVSLLAGAYSQLRLVLADSSATLTSSAEDLGLSYNAAVQYVDSSGASHIVPLEFGSPNSALLIPFSFSLEAISSSTLASTTSTSTSSESAAITLDIDALRNLTLFSYGDQVGALLNPGLKAYDDAEVGAISGQFDVSAISSTALDSDQGIIVSAEMLSSDGSRYVPVKNTRMDSDGNFTLSPLPVDDTGTSYYELVVHGPGVETVIISDVPVTTGDTTTVQSSEMTLPSSDSFTVNTSTADVPGGTQVGFYQTLPSKAQPHLIESAAVNPFGGSFPADVSLSMSDLVYGAYNDGNLISFSSAAAQEGAATYRVLTEAFRRAVSNSGATLTGSAANASETLSTLPQPNLPSDAVARTISGSINIATPDAYDSLYVLVSRGGQLVDAVDLSASLAGSSSVSFSVSNLPGGNASAVYEVALRAWNSGDAANTLARVAYADQIDLRQSDVSGVSLQLP